jgi:hypothetical protein
MYLPNFRREISWKTTTSRRCEENIKTRLEGMLLGYWVNLVQCQTMVLAVFGFRVLIPECYLTHRKVRNWYKILVVKPERKRPLERPRHRCGIILKWILQNSL